MKQIGLSIPQLYIACLLCYTKALCSKQN